MGRVEVEAVAALIFNIKMCGSGGRPHAWANLPGEKATPPPPPRTPEVVLGRLSREESILIYIEPQISRLSCSWLSHYIECVISTHISSL
jgi:hypothetical protein